MQAHVNVSPVDVPDLPCKFLLETQLVLKTSYNMVIGNPTVKDTGVLLLLISAKINDMGSGQAI